MIPKIIKQGLGIASGSFGQKAFGVINIFLLHSVLGLTSFGLFMLMMSVVNLVAQMSTFSLPNVIFKAIGKDKQQSARKDLLPNILYTALGTSTLSYVVLLAVADPLCDLILNSNQVGNFRTISLLVISTTFINVFRAILVNFDKVRKSIWPGLAEVMARTVGLLSLLLFDTSIEYAVAVYVLSGLAALTISVLFSYGILKEAGFRFSIGAIKYTLHLGNALFISSLGIMLVFNVDRLMLGWLSTPDNVGYYVLASTIANVLLMIHGSFATLFKPRAATLVEQTEYKTLEILYFTLGRWSQIMNGILFLFMNVFAIYILQVFIDITDADSVQLLILILSINALMHISAGPSSSLLQMAGGYRQEIFNTLMFLIVNILLNIFLIPEIGVSGAAIATVLSGLMRITFQLVQIKKMVGFFIIRWKGLLLFSMLSSLVVAFQLTGVGLVIQSVIVVVYSLAIMAFALRMNLEVK
ncbi:MAG: oligosaccharide flippase family protein [Bacteroidota bacterium]